MKNFFKHIGGFFRRDALSPKISLRIMADGFQFLRGEAIEANVHWDDVQKITAYKCDLFAYDEIHIAFSLASSESVDICEEWLGFRAVVKKMKKQFPSIPDDWLTHIVHPAFASNETVLYES